MSLKLLAAFLFFSSITHANSIDVVSHKGVHIPFKGRPGPNDCVATFIDNPMNYPEKTRYYVENTLPAISEAFAVGATRVSINLTATSDGRVVLFHDAELDCRTNGHGPTESKTFLELRSLNVAWNYTPDGGQTYPWRDANIVNRGFVTIPSLEEVFDQNPTGKFWIVLRPRNQESAKVILSALKNYPEIVRKSAIFAPTWVNDLAKKELPELIVPRLDMKRNKACLQGFFPNNPLPNDCSNLDIVAPMDVIAKLGVTVVEFSSKLRAMVPPSSLNIGSESGGYVDDVDSAQFIKSHQDSVSAFMTDRIDIVGPIFIQEGKRPPNGN